MTSDMLFPILRLMRADGSRFGTGKAQLLQHIQTHGSIAQAGQAMGMSYKRAWSLIHEMNQMFQDPLVITSRGGPKGGGAALTPTGQMVLQHFRALEHILTQEGAQDLSSLSALLRPAQI
jgi:molybdate transport system regulatory protein